MRQRATGNFTVDLMCKELMLVIEADGYSHNFKTEEDEKRDEKLKQLGFTAIRFPDNEVMKDLPNVQQTLEAFMEGHAG
jgi:very-short-patch-repair endonuclease